MTDYDPRLVALYDEDNPAGEDHDFYRALAQRIGARHVVDLGCGTGLLTVALAADDDDRRVVGIDPSPAMLGAARARDGADAVTWIEGDSGVLRGDHAGGDRAGGDRAGGDPVDLAVMTGNVAQHILDPAWELTLLDLRRAMADGGVVAFESRNPARRAWEEWATWPITTRATPSGRLREGLDVADLGGGLVRLVWRNELLDLGETLTREETLVFRDRATIERQLARAGFGAVRIDGDWAGTAFTGDERLMVVTATAGRD